MRLLLALAINGVLLGLTFLYMSHMSVAILLGILLLAWFFYFLWRRQNLVQGRIEDKIKGQKVIIPTEHIMFWAVESSGYSQISGMGYIALTDESLYFELALLDLVITVPTPQLKGAEFVYRLKGVSPCKKMLRILFKNKNNKDDSIAINVKEMEYWKNKIIDISGKS